MIYQLPTTSDDQYMLANVMYEYILSDLHLSDHGFIQHYK